MSDHLIEDAYTMEPMSTTEISYSLLERCFGEPHRYENEAGDETFIEWCFLLNGVFYSVRSSGKNPCYTADGDILDWTIGGDIENGANADVVCDCISNLLFSKVAPKLDLLML
jgi:hypothetical protein